MRRIFALCLVLALLCAPALAERQVWAYQDDVAFFEEDGKSGCWRTPGTWPARRSSWTG